MELIGTFLFVLVIALVVTQEVSAAPAAIWLTLGILVYAGAHISGSHFNPAVTLAVWMRGKISMNDALMYWVAQLVGAIVAALVAAWMTWITFVAAPAADMWVALVVEIIFTFMLAMVVLHTATTKSQSGNSYYWFAIGLTVMCGALAGGALSGGAFNPAVGLGPIIAAGGTSARWLYLVGPLVGGALAGLVFPILNGDEG